MVKQTTAAGGERRPDHSLDGIKATIRRAEESIGRLDKDVSAFFADNPPPYRVEGRLEDDRLKYVFKACGNPKPPLRFAVIAGEIVHELRSVLDHLVVALAVRNGQRPLKNHAFPVCRTREKFRTACGGGAIKGVSRRAFRRIVRAQPFRHGAPDSYTLSVIHDLDAQVKHGLLPLAVATARTGQRINVGVSKAADGSVPSIVGLGPGTARRISEEGTEVFSITLAKPVPDFHARADFVGQVVFERCGAAELVPVVPALTKMARFTRQLAGQFVAEL
jgi:hypothetical protein